MKLTLKVCRVANFTTALIRSIHCTEMWPEKCRKTFIRALAPRACLVKFLRDSLVRGERADRGQPTRELWPSEAYEPIVSQARLSAHRIPAMLQEMLSRRGHLRRL